VAGTSISTRQYVARLYHIAHQNARTLPHRRAAVNMLYNTCCSRRGVDIVSYSAIACINQRIARNA